MLPTHYEAASLVPLARSNGGPLHGNVSGAATDPRWRELERAVREYHVKGSGTRTNLAGPSAEKDKYGYLVKKIPSDILTDRDSTIWKLCEMLAPDFEFDTITVNKFETHEQCQHHVDRRNVGDSLLALLGSFKGGRPDSG